MNLCYIRFRKHGYFYNFLAVWVWNNLYCFHCTDTRMDNLKYKWSITAIIWKLHNKKLGPLSVSDKTSRNKILQSVEATRFVLRIALKFDKQFNSTAADVPVKFQSDNLNYQYRSFEIFETSPDLTIRRLIGYRNGAQWPWPWVVN